MTAYEITLFPSGKVLKFSEDRELIHGTIPRNAKALLEQITKALKRLDVVPMKMLLDYRKDEKFLHTENDGEFHSGCWDLQYDINMMSWRPYHKEGYINLLDPFETKRALKERTMYDIDDIYYGDIYMGDFFEKWNRRGGDLLGYIGYDPTNDEFDFGFIEPPYISSIDGNEIMKTFPSRPPMETYDEVDPYDANGLFGKRSKTHITIFSK